MPQIKSAPKTTEFFHGIAMETMLLGRTGITTGRSGFGALPIQRLTIDAAVNLLHKAFDRGFTFFDTARMYSDSEEKLGRAFNGKRDKVIFATKTSATTRAEVLTSVETSLQKLHTDYIDILQLHNPNPLPDAGDPDSAYAGLLEAKRKGMVHFVGISNHGFDNALKAVRSGLFDTLQYPLSSLSNERDLSIIDVCKKHGCGLIAMKAISGGLIANVATTFAFLRQYDNVLPIWGIQRESELEQFVALEANPPKLDAELRALIEKDRRELSGKFCRGCGYCQPCAADIPISWAARMSLLLRRAPSQNFLTEEWAAKMDRIDACTGCNACKSRCPYGLDTPNLLKENLKDYREFRSNFQSARTSK
jgi:predicted aldo/keto reductase-like oxidoreductase